MTLEVSCIVLIVTSWDNPPGMTIPSIYTDKTSSLYDPLKEPTHLPPTIVDLNYNRKNENSSGNKDDQIKTNLITMYRNRLVFSLGNLIMLGVNLILVLALWNKFHTILFIDGPMIAHNLTVRTWGPFETPFSLLIMQMLIEYGTYGKHYPVDEEGISKIMIG
ncbi:hypothetical protein RJT34_04371 [Clitoria ternatea]|uniref:Uncharacterized protein n=1 Tax=Clitoria ternatea TaxID=43366 RepID=A0AAN9KNZ2_CLITE